MAKPNIYISEKGKTQKWIREYALYVANDNTQPQAQLKQDFICFNYYNNIHDDDEFGYVTEVGNRTLPAVLNHIPLQRTLMDTLISEYTIRKFLFSIFVSDEDSLKKKQFNKSKEMFRRVNLLLSQTMFANEEQINEMSQQAQALNEMANKQPESEEEAQQIANIKQSLPAFNIQMKTITKELSNQTDVLEKEIDEIDRKVTYSYKEAKEEIAQKLLSKYYRMFNIKSKGTNNFRNQCITGKQFYYVDYYPENKHPLFEDLDPTTVTFPTNTDSDWVQDGPWVKFRKAMSVEDVTVKWGKEIEKAYGKTVLDELDELSPADNGTFVSTPEGAMLYDSQPYAGTQQGGISVDYIFYKSPVKINIKLSPNKHNGDYFRHFIDKYKEVIDERDYKYRNGTYIKKQDDKVVLKASDVENFDSKKGQYIKTKYSTDIYKAVVINNEYVVSEGKIYAIMRNPDDYSDVKLPVVGRTFNKVTKRPYSLIWSTKGLQDFYNIVHYHRELMLNLSGTKTIVFDRSQKPSTMPDDEWEEQKKLGQINIQTTDAYGNPIRSAFNQWGMHDLSVSPAIQYLNNILDSVKGTVGDIIGVSRQRVGDVSATDQVGTYERSLERSMIVTEILYFESDEVLAKALTHLLNLSTNYIYNNGGMFQHITSDLGSTVITVPKGLFKNTAFDIYTLASNEEVKELRELKDLLLMGYKDQQIPYLDVVSSMGVQSVAELTNKLQYFSEKAEKINNERAANSEAAAMKIEERKIQLKQEFDKYIQDQENKYKEVALQMDGKRLSMDEQKNQSELIIKKQELALKYMELANEQRSEDNAIGMNKYSVDIQAKLSALQTEINAMIQLKQIDKDERMDSKKIEVDKVKAKKMVKEHVSDK